MNPWVFLTLVGAVVVFLLDKLFRRKKWKDDSKAEKISLIVHMCSVGPYLFLSALGLFWGITGLGSETAFGQVVSEVTLMMAALYFIVALVAVVMSFILRAKGKVKASIWVNVIALAYIVVVLAINYLVGEIL